MRPRPKTFTWYLQPLILFPYNCTVSCGGAAHSRAQQQFVVQGAEWRLEEETQEHTLSSEIYTSPFPLQCTMNWLSGSGDFWCNARWHYWFIQDSITRMWTWSVGGVWSILAEHFVGFRLIDSPSKIYQHSRLWNILLDKWKWMMQVPCCNIWISEKKCFENYLALWTLDFYQIWKTLFCCWVVCMWECWETRGGGWWGRTCVSQCINNKLKYNTKTKHITILQILHNTAQLHILTIFYVGIGNIFVPWSIRCDGNVWRE